jgi:hypothetical protein
VLKCENALTLDLDSLKRLDSKKYFIYVSIKYCRTNEGPENNLEAAYAYERISDAY